VDSKEGNEHRQARLQSILEVLVQAERISVEKLSESFDVSPSTIRRDLMLLQKQGLLRRDYGGAASVEPLFYEAFALDSSFQEQVSRQSQEKRRIGAAAAELVADGETIAFSAGTTTTQVARSIPFRRRITIFTNAVNMAMELGMRKHFNVVLTGGAMRGAWFSLVGSMAVEVAQRMFYDKLFLGVSGISTEAGLTDHHPDEAAVNRVLIAQSRQKIIVADHTKFSVVAKYALASLESADLIITDTGLSEEEAASFLDRGINLRRV
jgi:DeoR/GlpR family transcriptional regulator of sugar metabolism